MSFCLFFTFLKQKVLWFFIISSPDSKRLIYIIMWKRSFIYMSSDTTKDQICVCIKLFVQFYLITVLISVGVSFITTSLLTNFQVNKVWAIQSVQEHLNLRSLQSRIAVLNSFAMQWIAVSSDSVGFGLDRGSTLVCSSAFYWGMDASSHGTVCLQ
jgi:hypothetical protein